MLEYIIYTDTQKSVSPTSSLHSPVHVDVECQIRIPALNNTASVYQESRETSSAEYTLSHQLQFPGQSCLLLSPGASPTVTQPGIHHSPDVTDSIGARACAMETTPNGEQEVKEELSTVVEKYREDMIRLMASLSGIDRSLLDNLDDEGFVNYLLEKIERDYLSVFDKQIRCKIHLYRYLHEKGYRHIKMPLELLMCNETIDDMTL